MIKNDLHLVTVPSHLVSSDVTISRFSAVLPPPITVQGGSTSRRPPAGGRAGALGAYVAARAPPRATCGPRSPEGVVFWESDVTPPEGTGLARGIARNDGSEGCRFVWV